MYAAEFSGKASTLASEDILTAYVFSLFRYLSSSKLPFKFLERAKNIDGNLLSLTDPRLTGMDFWPRFRLPEGKKCREGDVLILVHDIAQGHIAILIEAKYKSGLSNHLPQPSNKVEGYESGHQLADEYLGLMKGQLMSKDVLQQGIAHSNVRCILYVTAHHAFPFEDIKSAVDALRASEDACLTPEKDIYWLPWWHLYSLIDAELQDKSTGYSSGEVNLLADTRLALSMRGLRPFDPFRDLIAVEILDSLWTSSRLFTGIMDVPKYVTAFQRTLIDQQDQSAGDSRRDERC